MLWMSWRRAEKVGKKEQESVRLPPKKKKKTTRVGEASISNNLKLSQTYKIELMDPSLAMNGEKQTPDSCMGL